MLPPDLAAQMIRLQFQAQLTQYTAAYPAANYDLILEEGTPAGRLYVDRGKAGYRILDIALLPEHRGRGLGTQLLQAVLAEARAAGLPVRLSVSRENPALRLYRRLGFAPLAEEGFYLQMEYAPRN